MPDDYYVSKYSGEEIDALLGGAGAGTVRYDAAQTLTDAQKAQARANIAAAPSGFGLGGNSKLLTSDDDVNLIGASGWYTWVSNSVPANAIIVSNITIMRVDAYTPGVKVQTLYGATDGSDFITQPIVARRMIYGSKIGTWEYVNPPLYLGVEYRTTERYLGKPVYCRLIDFGSLPNATTKMVYFNNNSSIIISAVGITSYMVLLLGTSENEHNAELKARNNTITIKTTDNQTSYTATILVKYYKDTD